MIRRLITFCFSIFNAPSAPSKTDLLSKDSLHHFFFDSSQSQHPHELRKTLLKFVLVRVIIVSLILGIRSWELLNNHSSLADSNLIFTVIALTYGISVLNAFWLRYFNQIRCCSYLQLFLDILLATAAISLSGSLATVTLYLLVITAGAAIFGKHGAVIIASLCGLAYALLTSELFLLNGQTKMSADTQDLLNVYISLVLCALVSSYIAEKLRQAGRIVNEQAKSFNELSRQQELVFNQISDGLITVDIQSVITGINEAAKSIMGLGKLDSSCLIGKRVEELLAVHQISGLDEVFNSIEANPEQQQISIQTEYPKREVHLSCSVQNLCDSQGNKVGKVIIFDDISKERTIQERLDLHEQMTELLSKQSNNLHDVTPTEQTAKIIGKSQVMQKILQLVERISASEASVLISGESGTGKELIARAIHAGSARRQAPFVAINCGAIPESLIESELFGHKKGAFTGAINDNTGLFRQAQGGTIFLDEIGEIPLHLQVKLLRVLQERRIRAVGDTKDLSLDVRIIAASNRDLKKECAAGRFREDLFYRLNVINIFLPPLRERKEDIPLLVQHFITSYCSKDKPTPQISPEALQLLINFSYPGNIRELENLVERMLVLGGDAILCEHLPQEVIAEQQVNPSDQQEMFKHSPSGIAHKTDLLTLPIDLEEELAKLERFYLCQALNQSQGIKKVAAELLHLNFRSFRYRLKKYDLGDNNFGDSLDN